MYVIKASKKIRDNESISIDSKSFQEIQKYANDESILFEKIINKVCKELEKTALYADDADKIRFALSACIDSKIALFDSDIKQKDLPSSLQELRKKIFLNIINKYNIPVKRKS